MTQNIEAIYIATASAQPMESVNTADLVAGRGMVGDRYYSDTGTFSKKLKDLPDKELTIIEAEEIEQFNSIQGFAFEPGAFRRNIVTRGVRLNDLVDREFSIGKVRLRGIRLCEPCDHLARLTDRAVLRAMVHKAGLRARILDSGTINVNDVITL